MTFVIVGITALWGKQKKGRYTDFCINIKIEGIKKITKSGKVNK
jgi:hypothetical protein